MASAETDVITILTADHREMIELIGSIRGSSAAKQKQDLAETLIAEIMRHAVAEEMYVYPAIEDHVPNGSDDVAHDKEEHGEIVKVLKAIERAGPADPDFMLQIERLEEMLHHHARDEEDEQFPKLRAHVPRDKLFELGRQVEKAKRLAPTRPHPSAPHSELFHKTIGPGVGMVDRLRDALTGRHTG